LDGPDSGPLLPNQIFLFRRAYTHKYEASSGVIDAISDGLLFLGTKRRKWRRFRAHDLQVRKTGEEICLEFTQCLWRRAVEIDANLVTGSPLAKAESSCRTTHSLPKADFLKVVETPADRLAIGTDQVEAIELGTEDRVLRPFDEYGDGREIDNGRAATFSALDQKIDDFSVGGGGDRDPKDVILLGPDDWSTRVIAGIGLLRLGTCETHALLQGLLGYAWKSAIGFSFTFAYEVAV